MSFTFVGVLCELSMVTSLDRSLLPDLERSLLPRGDDLRPVGLDLSSVLSIEAKSLSKERFNGLGGEGLLSSSSLTSRYISLQVFESKELWRAARSSAAKTTVNQEISH